MNADEIKAWAVREEDANKLYRELVVLLGIFKAVEGILQDGMNEYQPIPKWAIDKLRAAMEV